MSSTTKSSEEMAFNAARHYVTSTVALWTLYNQLYRDQDNTRTMNDSAPSFFALLQMLLVDDILRRIAVLADPPESRKDKNLSLRGLMTCLQIDWKSHSTVSPLWKPFESAATPIVEYRHKMIAHLDLPTAVGDVAPPKVIVKDVIDAMACLVPLMDGIELSAFNCTTCYDVPFHGDGNSILRYARQARRYRELHIKHFYDNPVTTDVASLLARIKRDHE